MSSKVEEEGSGGVAAKPADPKAEKNKKEEEEEETPKLSTIYVGNLDRRVTEDFLFHLFSSVGPVKSCKVMNEGIRTPYAFVEFWEYQIAVAAFSMNGRTCFDKQLKVNWASQAFDQTTNVAGGHEPSHQIFVGDLDDLTAEEELKKAFAPFGAVTACRVVKEPGTSKSKGYGFVSFANKIQAQTAINEMNGAWLGTRNIRTNWALKHHRDAGDGFADHRPRLTFDIVFNQSSIGNTTVYCGRIGVGLTEELMMSVFRSFGEIVQIRAHSNKGYAFIKFAAKESATQAILAVDQTIINGFKVKCSWGNEATYDDRSSQSQSYHHAPRHQYPTNRTTASSFNQGYFQQQPQQQSSSGYYQGPQAAFANQYLYNWQQTGLGYWYTQPQSSILPSQLLQNQFR